MIKTGLKELDQFLGGGIKDGLITSISGQSATGKTQLVFQICLNALRDDEDILFQDTTGEFRPERKFEIVKNRNLDVALLENLKIIRVTNTAEQIKSLEKINDFEKH